MDLYEYRLRRLDADYAETIAAGERADRARSEAAERAHTYQPLLVGEDDTYFAAPIETPDLENATVAEGTPTVAIEPVESQPREPLPPLTSEEVNRIKGHMSTIKLKHEPAWAKALSDDQLVSMLRRVLDS